MLSRLPPELLLATFSYCPSHGLTQLLRVNRLVHNVALQVLYSSIPRLSTESSTECLTSLCFNDHACKLVRSLVINWEDIYLKDEIPRHGMVKNMARYGPLRAIVKRRLLRDRFTLLRTVLKRLCHLTSLTLIVSARDSLSDVHAATILSGCTFSLEYFKTTFIVGTHIMEFLQKQPYLKELHLASGSKFVDGVCLPPGACSRLERFSWSWGNQRDLVAMVITGRPLRHISVVLSSRNARDTIDMLAQATSSIESVVFTLRDTLSEDLLQYITSRLPHLIQLKLSLATMPHKDVIDSMAAFTSHSHTLHSLVLVIRGVNSDSRIDSMKHIILRWVGSCSTLEVIHFPEISGRLTKKSADCEYMKVGSNRCCEGTCLTVRQGKTKSTIAVISLLRGPCSFPPLGKDDIFDPKGKAYLLNYLQDK